jgi:hypothetical protein
MFEFFQVSSQADSKAIDGFCTIGLCLELGFKKTSFCHVKLPKVGDFAAEWCFIVGFTT